MDKVQFCYGLFFVALLCFLIPIDIVQGAVSMLCLFGVWLCVLIFKKKDDVTDLQRNHYQWLNRSFWMFNLYGLIAFLIFTSVFSANGDHTLMEGLLVQIEAGEAVSIAEIEAIELQYREQNQSLLTILYASIFGPFMTWGFWRLIRGWRQYRVGEELDKVKTWL